MLCPFKDELLGIRLSGYQEEGYQEIRISGGKKSLPELT
jgi:hypothetical protein